MADETPASSGAISKEDAILFMGEDNDEKETIPLKDEKKVDKKDDKKDDKKEIKEPDESDDELPELEDEPKKSDGKSLELVTPVSKTVVLKKYPDLFKDFPDLETAYNRELAFTERFPTLKDADNALRDSETLERFESDLMDGNTENMLTAAKKADPEVFNKIVDDYLVTLGKVDQKAYYHVISNTIRHTVITMLNEAKTSKDEKLQEAAEILNYYVFGTAKIEAPTNLSSSNPEKSKLADKEKEFSEKKYKDASSSLETRFNTSIKNTIEANIDPQNKMREYDKRNAIRDVKEELENEILKDTRFKTVVNKMWKDAAADDYSKESVDKIKTALFGKAKSLLPAILKKVRAEAIQGKKVVEAKEAKVEDKKDKKEKPKEAPRSSRPNGTIPKGMTTLDFLNAED